MLRLLLPLLRLLLLLLLLPLLLLLLLLHPLLVLLLKELLLLLLLHLLHLLQLSARPSLLLTLLLQSYAGQSCCLDCGIWTIGIRNRNRIPGTQIFQETRFGGEQSDARAGAARFCQVMLLERSIHADASARRRVCGSHARATAWPSWASLAAVRCAAARGEAISRCALGGRRTEVYLTWRDGLEKKGAFFS